MLTAVLVVKEAARLSNLDRLNVTADTRATPPHPIILSPSNRGFATAS